MTKVKVGILLLTTALIQYATSDLECSEDYTPCTCIDYGYGGEVFCEEVTMSEDSYVFSHTNTVELFELSLTPSPTDDVIPSDLLDNKHVAVLMITCPTSDYQLKIDENAFRSTENFTTYFEISNCDLSQLDFKFLTYFDNLVTLTIQYSSNIHHSFPSLPVFKSLSTLYIDFCTGVNEIIDFPTLTKGLSTLYMNHDQVDDQTMSRVLDWLLSNSVETFQYLKLEYNQLTKIPEQIALFPKLYTLNILNNSIPTIPEGSLFFSSPVQYLDVSKSGVNHIESGAFQGDYSNAWVNLNTNNLTRFEKSVFETMLTQMTSQYSSGSLYVYQNTRNYYQQHWNYFDDIIYKLSFNIQVFINFQRPKSTS